jgi:hypothetical protein
MMTGCLAGLVCILNYPTGEKWFWCPWGKMGELLWVREAWAVDAPLDQVRREYEDVLLGIGHGPYFRADPAHENAGLTWRPPSTLPRWASRIVLKITSVGVRQIQEISEEEAQAAGVDREFRTCVMHPSGIKDYHMPLSYRGGFANILSEVIGTKNTASWESNPWCWFVSVKQAPL